MHETQYLSVPKNVDKLFSLFLEFYPSTYRKKFGHEMILVLHEMYHEELRKKGNVGMRFWAWQFSDLATSAFEQHREIQRKLGMKKYLQQTLHVTIYNTIGGIFLLPIILMVAIDLVSRILQGDVIHYNRPVYAFLSHTPLYWFPILFTWAIIFPCLAVLINLIPLIKNLQTKPRSFLKNNILTVIILCLGLGFLVMIKLHDVVPCIVNGLFSVGFAKISTILSVCKNA